MDRNKTIMITKNFITEFYNLGSAHDIIAHMEDSVTGFGTQSRFYSVGLEAVSTLLYKELALVSPCKVVKLRLKEERISRESVTVFATVVLRTAKESNALAMHRLIHRVPMSFIVRMQDIRFCSLMRSFGICWDIQKRIRWIRITRRIC